MHAFVEEEKRDRAPPTKKHFDLCDITIRVLFSLHLTHVIERDEKIHTKFETAALSFFVSTFTALFEEFLPPHRLSIFYPGMILALKLDFISLRAACVFKAPSLRSRRGVKSNITLLL